MDHDLTKCLKGMIFIKVQRLDNPEEMIRKACKRYKSVPLGVILDIFHSYPDTTRDEIITYMHKYSDSPKIDKNLDRIIEVDKFPYFFNYVLTSNPTFGDDFWRNVEELGGFKVRSNPGWANENIFYVIPSLDVYDKLSEINKEWGMVEMYEPASTQKLVGKYPILLIDRY